MIAEVTIPDFWIGVAVGVAATIATLVVLALAGVGRK